MSVTTTGLSRIAVSPALGVIAGAGAVAALAATYWDDAWHTDKGRDGATIPPHLLLYGGVAVAALAVAVWGVQSVLRAGLSLAGLRRALAQPALLLAGLGGGATLVSAPIDAAWHTAFGRDSVLWSPPHLLAVIGTLALNVGLLAGLRHTLGRGAGTVRTLAGAGVLGSLQVLVLEYDSDVPQFSTVYFLPVAALALCAAAALLDDLLPGRWAPARAAAIYTLARVTVVLGLGAFGFSSAEVPPVLPLLALFAATAALAPVVRLVLLGAAAPLLWVPTLMIQSDVTTVVPWDSLPVAVLLSALAGAVVAVVHADVDLRRALRPSGTGALILVPSLTIATSALLVASPRAAEAHDPGQGQQERTGVLTITRSGHAAQLLLDLDGPCAGLIPERTVARRAGRTLTGPLTLTTSSSHCELVGSVAGLDPDGRYFVYAQGRDRAGQVLEAWLPSQPQQTIREVRPLYRPAIPPSTGTRDLAGAGLLAGSVALLAACLRLARRSRLSECRPPTVGAAPGSAS